MILFLKWWSSAQRFFDEAKSRLSEHDIEELENFLSWTETITLDNDDDDDELTSGKKKEEDGNTLDVCRNWRTRRDEVRRSHNSYYAASDVTGTGMTRGNAVLLHPVPCLSFVFFASGH